MVKSSIGFFFYDSVGQTYPFFLGLLFSQDRIYEIVTKHQTK